MKNNAHLISQFKRFEDLNDDEVSTAVVEDIVAALKRGNDILAKQVLTIIKCESADFNIRCSALETFNAANPIKFSGEFVEVLWHILRRDEDENVQRTAINIYADRNQSERRLLRDMMQNIAGPCGHREKLAAEILEAEIEAGAL